MALSIIEAIRDPRLLGAHPSYRAGLETFREWLVIHAAIHGEPLDEVGRSVFERFAGRPYTDVPEGGWSTVAILSPRRCGKSLFASTQVAWSAVRPGPRNTWSVLVGQDRAGVSKSLLATVGDFFSDGLLAQSVVNRTAESIELESSTIAVWPTRPAACRGIAARIAVLDEADFTSTEGGEDKTRSMVAALRPTLAGSGSNGKLILISSPGRVGSFFHKLISDFYGKSDPHTLVLKLDTSVNATLDPTYFEAMRTLDPIAYRAEVLGEYVETDAGLYDHLAIANCVVSGRGDIDPEAVKDERIVCAVDAATGTRNGDSFAAIWGYREGDRVVVVAVRRFAPPFDPKSVIAEISDLCRAYGTRRAVGDRFGSKLIASLFREAGLTFESSTVSTSDALLELAPAFSSGALELPDPSVSTVAADLVDDLRAVVRRAGGGRDRADAPRNSRGHCDTAAALGVLFAALPKKRERVKVAAPILLKRGAGAFHGRVFQPFTVPSLLGNMAEDFEAA